MKYISHCSCRVSRHTIACLPMLAAAEAREIVCGKSGSRLVTLNQRQHISTCPLLMSGWLKFGRRLDALLLKICDQSHRNNGTIYAGDCHGLYFVWVIDSSESMPGPIPQTCCEAGNSKQASSCSRKRNGLTIMQNRLRPYHFTQVIVKQLLASGV